MKTEAIIIKNVSLANMILVISFLSGCSVFDYQSTKTESPVIRSNNEELESRVAELEKRVKALEEKVQKQW